MSLHLAQENYSIQHTVPDLKPAQRALRHCNKAKNTK